MTRKPTLPLLVLAALTTACERPAATAPESPSALETTATTAIVPVPESGSALRPSFSAHADPGASWSDAPLVLDFESLATADPVVAVGPTYSESGYTFGVSGDAAFASAGPSSRYYAGSAGLFLNNIESLDVILTRDDGKLFSATAIALAPLITGVPGVVAFVGTRADGSTVTQTVTTGTEMTFTPYALDGFTSLVELRWTQQFAGWALHQFDDVVVSDARPEAKDECFGGGWARYGFRNQGQCVRTFETGSGPAGQR